MNIVTRQNKKFYQEDQADEVNRKKIDEFLGSDFNISDTYKVRIFNQYVPFSDVVLFIEKCHRARLLDFLRNFTTIGSNLQGELIHCVDWQDTWKVGQDKKFAAFLAFGYYADTCGKFLLLTPDCLLNFLENAVYSMYLYKDVDKIQPVKSCFEDFIKLTKERIEIDREFSKPCCIKLKKI
jgi:hypothetical protein